MKYLTKNNHIEDIASLASNDKIDVVPSTSFNFDDPDNVNGADQNVTGNQDNARVLLEPHSDVSLPVID